MDDQPGMHFRSILRKTLVRADSWQRVPRPHSGGPSDPPIPLSGRVARTLPPEPTRELPTNKACTEPHETVWNLEVPCGTSWNLTVNLKGNRMRVSF